MLVSPAAFQKSAAGVATQPVGAGPFKMTSYVPISDANLVRNPGYIDAGRHPPGQFHRPVHHQPAGDPRLPRVLVRSTWPRSPQQAASAKAAGYKIDVIPPGAQRARHPNDRRAVTTRVAEAINYAINRQAILKVQASGYGAVSYQPFPKGYVGYNPRSPACIPTTPARRSSCSPRPGSPGLEGHPEHRQQQRADRRAAPEPAQAGRDQRQHQGNAVRHETQFLYLNKTLPLAIDGTAARDSPVEMLDVLYGQKGLMDVDGKKSATPPAVAQASAKPSRGRPPRPSTRLPCSRRSDRGG